MSTDNFLPKREFPVLISNWFGCTQCYWYEVINKVELARPENKIFVYQY